VITGVERVDLRVHDLERALWLYGEVFGLEVDGTSLRAPGGGPVLITLRDDGVTQPSPRRATGLFHTAIRFPTREELGGALRRVANAGVRLSGASDHGVSEALYLDDPSGNGVELYWDRARELWPEEMFTEPLDLDDLIGVAADSAAAPPGTDIGHVHLKASDVDRTAAFFVKELGFQMKTIWPGQAAFVAVGDYHHHVGINAWLSRGAGPTPPEAAGLDRVVFGTGQTVYDPDGIVLELPA
jgi:catechol 2,3-dioxygenase